MARKQAPKIELRSLDGMHTVEKLLLGVALVIGFLGLWYAFMVIHWASVEGVIVHQMYKNLIWVLVLLGFIVNSIFWWRIVELFNEIKGMFKKA